MGELWFGHNAYVKKDRSIDNNCYNRSCFYPFPGRSLRT